MKSLFSYVLCNNKENLIYVFVFKMIYNTCQKTIDSAMKLKEFVPKPKKIRPTASKVKEALFNILRDKIVGAEFLDLYAGKGAIGMDALNRGAVRVVFIDINANAIRAINAISKERGLKNKLLVIKGRAYEVLNRFIHNRNSFDILFVDPPYHSDEIERVMPLIGKGDILNDNAYVVVEHYHKKHLSENIGSLLLKKRYRYGDTVLSLYEKT